MTQRRILDNFVIKEISAVDRPAQEGAKMIIMKRAGGDTPRYDPFIKREFTADQRKEAAGKGQAMPDGSYPIQNTTDLHNAVMSFGRGGSKPSVKAHIISRARSLGAYDSLPDSWKGGTSKADVSKADKELAAAFIAKVGGDEGPMAGLQPGVEQVIATLRAEWPDIAKSIEQATEGDDMVNKANVSQAVERVRVKIPNTTSDRDDEEFGDIKSGPKTKRPDATPHAKRAAAAAEELNKALEGLEDPELAKTLGGAIQGLVDSLAKGQAPPDGKKKKPPEGSAAEEGSEDSEEEAAEMGKRVEQLEDENKLLKAQNSFNDEERGYFANLPNAIEKKKFAGMSADQRKQAMSKARDGDETITVEGQVIRKSAVGEAQFNILKAQQKRMDDLEKRATDAEERRTTAEVTKRVSEEFSHLPGKTDDKVAVFKAIGGLSDDKVRKNLEQMLSAGEKMAKAGFERIGVNRGSGIEKGGQEFTKRVDDIIAKNPNMKRTDAMTKARSEFPEEFEAYQATTNGNGAAN